MANGAGPMAEGTRVNNVRCTVEQAGALRKLDISGT